MIAINVYTKTLLGTYLCQNEYAVCMRQYVFIGIVVTTWRHPIHPPFKSIVSRFIAISSVSNKCCDSAITQIHIVVDRLLGAQVAACRSGMSSL